MIASNYSVLTASANGIWYNEKVTTQQTIEFPHLKSLSKIIDYQLNLQFA